jgi:hypothetical protein
MLDVLELGFVLVLLAGVALVSVPAALVLGGVLGVVACERRSAARGPQVAADEAASPTRLRRVA